MFESWLRILEKLEFGLCAKYWSLGIVLVAYIIGIVTMLAGANRQKKRDIAKDQIINYLTQNSYEMMKLETIRAIINKGYTDEFLNSLPIHFPNEIRRAKLKGNHPGLARIIEENNGSEA